MSYDALDSASPLGLAAADEADRSLSADVDSLMRQADPFVTSERRARARYPIPFTFQLIPLDDNGKPRLEMTTTVVGKHLSQNGISFSHDRPLPCRGAIVSLIHPNVGRFAVEVDLLWTRRTVIGIYESGGRLIRTVRGHTLWSACDPRRMPSCPGGALNEARE
jgi:hypothetical protein